MRSFLFVVTGLLLASIVLWPVLFMAGAMSFDAPGADENPLTQLIMLWTLTYPLPIIIGAIGVWRHRADKSLGRIKLYTFVSALCIIIPVILFSLLGIFCDGNFACNA